MGKTRTNVLFDVVVPFYLDLTLKDITDELKNRFTGDDGMEYNFIVDIDRDYVSPPSEEESEEKAYKKAEKEEKLLEEKEKDNKKNNDKKE